MAGHVPLCCAGCGGIVHGMTFWVNLQPYHSQCLPGATQQAVHAQGLPRYEPIPLTEDDVRRIVREEMRKGPVRLKSLRERITFSSTRPRLTDGDPDA